jgi:hypothetical protein
LLSPSATLDVAELEREREFERAFQIELGEYSLNLPRSDRGTPRARLF